MPCTQVGGLYHWRKAVLLKILQQLDASLKKVVFELLDDRRSRIIEKIKNIIVELIHYSDNDLKVNLSTLLSQKLNYDYHHLSSLFSEVEGITIDQYIINQKIEKVKELLM